MSRFDDEILPPGTERFYTIRGWNKWVEPDGVIILRACATDGTEVWLAHFPATAIYEVLVEGPHEPKGGRRYRGGAGSPAYERFEKYLSVYTALFGLDDGPRAAETDARQDE